MARTSHSFSGVMRKLVGIQSYHGTWRHQKQPWQKWLQKWPTQCLIVPHRGAIIADLSCGRWAVRTQMDKNWQRWSSAVFYFPSWEFLDVYNWLKGIDLIFFNRWLLCKEINITGQDLNNRIGQLLLLSWSHFFHTRNSTLKDLHQFWLGGILFFFQYSVVFANN